MGIEIIYGDIINSKADAIVNAANSKLKEGGGVCGCIFESCKDKYALEDECFKIGECKTGQAVITKGYGLAKYIIHAVGPKCFDKNKKQLLKSAYINSLKLADEYKLKSIAFPALSTGNFGYPVEEAAEICIDVIKNYKSQYLKKCYLYLYDDYTYQVFYDEYLKQYII